MCLFFKEASEREKKNFFMFMKNNKNLLCTKSYFPQWPYQQRGPLMMKKVLLIVLCVCTAHFLWRLFFRTEIWRIMMKKKKTTKLLSLSQRCNVDSPAPKKGKKEKTSAEVHRRSQIIRNIYVAQINSRWNESAEDICKILKCTFFTRPYHAPLLPSLCSFLFFRCVNLQINNIKHEISWGSLCFLPRFARLCLLMRRNTISRLWCISHSYDIFLAITVFEMLFRNVPSTAKSTLYISLVQRRARICNFHVLCKFPNVAGS